MQKSIIRAVLICLSIKNMHAMTDPITDPISVRTVDDKIVIVSKPDIQHFATLKNALVDSSELRDSPISVSRVTKEVLEQLVNDVRSEDVQDEALVPMQKAIALLSGADYLQTKMGLVEKYAKIVAKGLLSDEWMQKFHESSAEHPCLNPHGLTDRLKNLLYRYMPDRWINRNTIFLEGGDRKGLWCESPAARIMAVGFSLDSSEMSLVSQDGFISRVKKNGEIIQRISFYNKLIGSATLCVKNNLLLLKNDTEDVIVDFTNDTQNVIVDVKNPACLNENKKEHYYCIRDYTNDFSKLAIIDDRKNLKIVDRSAKKEPYTKEPYTQDKFYYNSPYFSPDGSIMLINNGKDEARIVYLTAEKTIDKIKHHFSNSALFFSDSSKLLAVEVTYDEYLLFDGIYGDTAIKEEHFNVVETKTGKVLAQIKYDGRLKSAKLSLDNNMLFIDSMTGENERALSIINLQTTKAVSIIKYQNCLSDNYPCAEFLSDASKVFIAYGPTESEASNVFGEPKIKIKSIIRIIDTKAAKEIQKIEYDGLLVNSARLSHDEKALAVSFHHGSLIILDTLMGKEIYRQEGCGCSLPLSFSPDSSIILAYAKETAISIIKRVTCTFDQALVIRYLSWARNNNKTPSDSHFIRGVVNTSEDKDWLNNQLSQKDNCIAGSASSKNE